MLGYLQSQDRISERLKRGPDEAFLTAASESEIKQLPMVGSFSDLAGRRTLFYRWDGELRLRVGDLPPIRLSDVEAAWSRLDNTAVFTLKQGGKQILHKVYPLSPDIQSIETDPTPFVEAEDFDLFLLVRNVLHDPKRADRIYQNASELRTHLEAVERKLLSLLEQLKHTLRQEHYKDALEETEAGEPGVALHAICDHLRDYGLPVPQQIYEQIEAIGQLMKMPERTWTSLAPKAHR